eukprot:CAMPEP_0194227504 /NCGR_PEP_ID=MMETSP0156-20130528/42892_1 /TAXON_ID=33649 /ORGANISM="Thalassionema nitzschioides, Strain L26-B" /LENGTH=514 /DNA_ID=CAMNT_0038959987 /DNA_START=1212 /DNA_END=2756 /DNA_ORIENTATION=-
MTPSNKLVQDQDLSSSSLRLMSRTESPSSDVKSGESDNTSSGPLRNNENKRTEDEKHGNNEHEQNNQPAEATNASHIRPNGAHSSGINPMQSGELQVIATGSNQIPTKSDQVPEVPLDDVAIPTKSSTNASNSDQSSDMARVNSKDKRLDTSPDLAFASSARSGITPPLEEAGISSEPQVPSTVEVPAQPKLSQPSPLLNPLLPKFRSDGQYIPAIRQIQTSKQSASPTSSKSKQARSLRRGKWTVEEEAYVARVIQDFNSGYLNAPAGTTLRSYLSEKLQCDPMRITKKFTGAACIGKRVFHPAVRCPSNTAAIDKAQAELDALERRWRRRLEIQQRESAKKAAASAAAAAAAATGRSHFSTSTGNVQAPQSQNLPQNLVTKTASWLDRANAILSAGQFPRRVPESHPSSSSGQDHARAVKALPQHELEDQMKEVERLIHEGPIIQQTTAGLPHLLEQANQGPPKPELEPADKRLRRCTTNDRSGAEDAEALVGFLNSVRAAAAAGTTTGHAD